MAYDPQPLFSAQQKHQYVLRKSTAEERKAKLRRLKACISKNEEELYRALQQDLGKSTFEAAVTEVIFIYGEIDFAVKYLSHWMKPRRAGRTLSNFFAKNRCHYEPKGVCLIISPWNYPFQLLMSPLVSAIAAGNCAILKPSELSPATSAVLETIISNCFQEEEICCLQGGAELASELLKLPFDHIFFTGSIAIGQVVMEAAAKHLASVTLELGGKSPVIIDTTADLENAARKIAWGKLVNAGQTCIAPDYVLLPRNTEENFIRHFRQAVQSLFLDEQGEPEPGSYGKIVNERHFKRLCEMISDATSKGAQIRLGGPADEKTRVIHPVLLSGATPDSRLLQEEIFGPILPIVTYDTLEDAIAYVNGNSKPLAQYIFSENKRATNEIIRNTSAGGTCVNNVLVHIANPKLPFGGTGKSGTGSCHGIYGFKAFSHERAVVFQSRPDFSALAYPPYGKKTWLLKWLKKII